MKRSIFLSTLMLALCAWVLPLTATAQDDSFFPEESTSKSKKSKKKKKSAEAEDWAEGSVIGSALAEVTYLTDARPNPHAKYYIFLHSGSWCPPCRALMPKVVDEYKKLKRKKIELILVCAEQTEEEGKEYPKHYKAKFPAAMPAAMNGIPGYVTAPSYPYAIIVDKTGRLVERGHGQIILNWKDIIKKDKAKNTENE